MPLYRAQVSLQDVSGLPRDQYVNTFWFTRAGSTAFISGPVAGGTPFAISNFYDELRTYFGKSIRQNGHTIKFYDHAAPLHAPPVGTNTFNFTSQPGASADVLPGEVASCLTFHANQVVGPGWFPQSSRGRVYLGPLNVNAADGNGRPGTPMRFAAVDAAIEMDDRMRTDTSQLVVFSRKHNMVLPVASFGMDDAWDTQRSRGIRPTNSHTVAVAHEIPPNGPA